MKEQRIQKSKINAFVCPTAALPSAKAISDTLLSTAIALATHVQALVTTSLPNQNVHHHLHLQPPSPSTHNVLVGSTNTRHANFNTSMKHRTVYVNQSKPAQQHHQQQHQQREDEDKATEEKGEKYRRSVANEAYEILSDQFVDETDIPLDKIKKKLDRKKLYSDLDLDNTLQWLFSCTEDPFTRYLPKNQLLAMQSDIQGSMCGVGLIFTAEYKNFGLSKHIIIKYVVPNSPADKAGLKYGDQITAIDMTNVQNLTFDDTTRRLLGQEGQKVLVTFKNKFDLEFSVLLERKKFEVPTVHYEIIGDIGYIQIREFALNTSVQIKKVLKSLYQNSNHNHNVQMFILDLRGNSGGLVDKAIEVAKLFLNKDDTVVQFIGRNNETFIEKNNNDIENNSFHQGHQQSSSVYKLLNFFTFNIFQTISNNSNTNVEIYNEKPVIILVDHETASASELVASAIRDNCHGIVVGRNTFGKGSVQAIVPLSNGGGAAITVARYRTPRNESIVAGSGIRPDWIKADLGDEASTVVKSLFGNKPEKKLKWMAKKIKKCGVEKEKCHRQTDES